MFPRTCLGLLVCSLPLLAVDVPKPVGKAKEAGQLDPKQFKAICESADVIVVGKTFAILTAELDSEPPTPVYTVAKIEARGMKILKGREKVGGRPESKIADAFEELSQPAETFMGKTVIVAFKWEGKTPKLLMLSVTNPTDLALIIDRYPEAK